MGARQVFLLCGDVNVQGRERPAEVFDRVGPALAGADLLFADLEMALYRPDALIEEKPGWTQSDPRMVEALVAAGFAAVGCANNVVHGDEAIRSTLAVLDNIERTFKAMPPR